MRRNRGSRNKADEMRRRTTASRTCLTFMEPYLVLQAANDKFPDKTQMINKLQAAWQKKKVWPVEDATPEHPLKINIAFLGIDGRRADGSSRNAFVREVITKNLFNPSDLNLDLLHFNWVDDPNDAQVRISFDAQKGAWSMLGTDSFSAVTDSSESTMNLGWLDDPLGEPGLYPPDARKKGGVIIHEFLHLLSFVHEQQSPVADIKWNREEVIRLFKQPPNSWKEPTIEHNILNSDLEASSNGAYDPDSIMGYLFDCRCFQDCDPPEGLGCTPGSQCMTGGTQVMFAPEYPCCPDAAQMLSKQELSAGDKRLLRKLYTAEGRASSGADEDVEIPAIVENLQNEVDKADKTCMSTGEFWGWIVATVIMSILVVVFLVLYLVRRAK